MAGGGDDTIPQASYVLVELESLDGIFAPIKNTTRVKYTCFDVSRRFVVFGTSSGGLILFQQETFTYLNTVPNKDGAVSHVSIAPDENILGFSTSRGQVIVVEHNAEKDTVQPQRLQASYEHKGAQVTCLQWNSATSKLFVGDDKGKVSVINVSTSRTRNLFQVPTVSLMKLDSKVVQMDYAQDHLLVSTLTRCYLCDTTKEQFSQIGKKLREGEYGACFFPGFRFQDACTIYAARPGSRLWEVDIKGNVLCTHQFKQALAIPPEKLISYRKEIEIEALESAGEQQSLNFIKLFLLWPGNEDCPFIFTWSQQGVYVFDPRRAEVILWCENITGIRDAICYRGDIYIHYSDGSFAKYSMLTLERAVCHLYQQGLLVHCAQLILLKQLSLCAARFNLHVPSSILMDILQKLNDMNRTSLCNSLSTVLSHLGLSSDKLSQSSRASSAKSEPVCLESGMFVVSRGRGHDSDDEIHRSSFRLNRWRSASPMFRHSSGSPHSSPSKAGGRMPRSPRRGRSGTPPHLSSKEAHLSSRLDEHHRTKTRADGSVIGNSTLKSQDSFDSETSGRPSEESEGTRSTTSSTGDLCSLPPSLSSDAKLDNHKSVPYNEVNSKDHLNDISSIPYGIEDETLAIDEYNSLTLLDRRVDDHISKFDHTCDVNSSYKDKEKGTELLGPNDLDKKQSATVNIKHMPNNVNDIPKAKTFHSKTKSPRHSRRLDKFNSSSNHRTKVSNKLPTSVESVDGRTASGSTEEVTQLKATSDALSLEQMRDTTLCDMYMDMPSYDMYGYLQMTVYGGMLLPPGFDFSLLKGVETGAEFTKLKESIVSKLVSGKKVVLQNLKEFEMRLRHRGSEPDSDIRSKTNHSLHNHEPIPEASTSDAFMYEQSESLLEHQQEEKNFWSFLPSIDASAFIETTSRISNQVKSPEILYNKKRLQPLLLEWVNQLHTVQKQVLDSILKMKHSSQPTTSVHSCRDDDTLKSVCSQGTSPGSSPSEVADICDKVEQEENSVSSPDVHRTTPDEKQEEVGSFSSIAAEPPSESSTLISESMHLLFSTLEKFVFVHDPFFLSQETHQQAVELAMMCFQMKIWGRLSDLESALVGIEKRTKESGSEKSGTDQSASLHSVNRATPSKDSSSHVQKLATGSSDNLVHLNEVKSPEVLEHDTIDSTVRESKLEAVESKICKQSEIDKSEDIFDISKKLISMKPKNGDVCVDLINERSIVTSGSSEKPKILQEGQWIVVPDVKERKGLISERNTTSNENGSKVVENWTNDEIAAKFIQNYFHMMDILRIKELIILDEELGYRTWLMLMEGVALLKSRSDFCQKINTGQISAAADSLEKGYWEPLTFLCYLLILFKVLPSKAVQLCITRCYQVSPLDVIYLAKATGNYPASFLAYINCIFTCLPEVQRPLFIDKLLQPEKVRLDWLTEVMKQEKSQELKCSCGSPRPGSHFYPWQHSDMLQYILKSTSAHKEKLIELSFQFGFWHGYLYLAKKHNLIDKHRLTVLQLGDINLLSDRNELGYLPKSEELWKELLHMISQQHSLENNLTCLTCGEPHSLETTFPEQTGEHWTVTLTWEAFARRLLEHVGPEQTLSLLKGVEIRSGSLSAAFYQACILSVVMNKQQSALTHRMLTRTESYLWSRRPTTVPPEVHYSLTKEKQKPIGADLPQSQGDLRTREEKYLEEPEGHWGTVTCLKKPCCLCGVLLTSRLSETGGVTVCPHGHAFHDSCSPAGCAICLCSSPENQ